jgi:hypothetical protein
MRMIFISKLKSSMNPTKTTAYRDGIISPLTSIDYNAQCGMLVLRKMFRNLRSEFSKLYHEYWNVALVVLM